MGKEYPMIPCTFIFKKNMFSLLKIFTSWIIYFYLKLMSWTVKADTKHTNFSL